MASTIASVGTKAATSAGPYATQLLMSGRWRSSSTPTSRASAANGSVYASGSATSATRIRIHQAVISQTTTAQNRIRRSTGRRPGRVAATPRTAPQAASRAAMCRGESKARASAISAAAYPLHSTVAASRCASGRRSRGRVAASTCRTAPTASTPNADQTAASPATRPAVSTKSCAISEAKSQPRMRARWVVPNSAATAPTPTAPPRVNRVSCRVARLPASPAPPAGQTDDEDQHPGQPQRAGPARPAAAVGSARDRASRW